MSKEQLIALAVREGIPAAIRFIRILKLDIEGVTPQMWDELETFASVTAADYKRAIQKSPVS